MDDVILMFLKKGELKDRRDRKETGADDPSPPAVRSLTCLSFSFCSQFISPSSN